MFDVTVTCNYRHGFQVDNGNQIFGPGQTYQFPHWSGDHAIHLWGMGDLIILDIGQERLKQYDNPKLAWTNRQWGGLVRFRGSDAYFRYDGTGHLTVVIDQFGSTDLHFDQGGMIVRLDDLTVS